MQQQQQQINFIKPNWDAPTKIKAYTTLRHAWGQQYLTTENINIASHQDLKSLLQLPADPIWIKQIHGTRLVEATLDNQSCEADASFTTQPHRICTILTADCLPILLCNPSATIVAAIHAGWRGLSNGIIENTILTLRQTNRHWIAWLGPAIGPKHFEVGKDVYQAFISYDPSSAVGFTPLGQDKWLADFYTLAKLKLINCGVTHIYGGEYCTYSQKDLFYSYRRDKGITGRMASVIWIDR
jgi:YfiH family protein